jgi:ribosomal-protein-alanine N-acetyltransferase
MMELNFTPFPLINTGRLNLRQVSLDDVDEVFALRSNPEVMRYIPRPLAITQQNAIDHINVINKGVDENKSIHWAITLAKEDKLIGMICILRMQPENFRTEIGYILDPNYHQQGIMDEALKRVIKYAFEELKFHSLEALIDPENTASERLLIKNNFVKEAHFKEKTFYNGVFLDDVIYSLINSNSASS